MQVIEDPSLQDAFGRRFSYLRLSLTDRCNFRCTYCLPHGFRKQPDLPAELSRDELRRGVEGFAHLGLWKVRLTGGEPTVHAEFEDIARDIASIDGISTVAMTTNGYRLAERAHRWRSAGIGHVNVSIDTLDRAGFARITGHDRLDEVIAGVDAAIEAGFQSVKVNSVLMAPPKADEWNRLLDFIAERDVSWRFIELMRTNENTAIASGNIEPREAIEQFLHDESWSRVGRSAGSGPAIEYAHPAYRGRIGLIAPYASGFCDGCNRLRLSSRGKLHLCLFGDGGVDLRPLLQRDGQLGDLVEQIRAAVSLKPAGHRLHEGDSGATRNFASIGG